MKTLFYTILFSLGEPKQNLYCHMLTLQLAALKATKTLKEEDEFYILADADTADYLNRVGVPQPAKLIRLPYKPTRLLEGVCFKFLFPKQVQTNGRVCVYLDLDMLAVRECRFDCAPDTLQVYPEGLPSDTNYKGNTPFINLKSGLSSGFFIYRYGPQVEALFADIFRRLDAEKEEFYTLEQPHYNHAVDSHLACVRFLDHRAVSFNGNNNQQTACFYNLCGDPGDGPFHFQKMLAFFVRRFVA